MKSSLRRRAAPSQDHGLPHLVFTVGADAYALPLSVVREIVGLGSLAAAPAAPAALRGVMDLRGERVAVVDLGVVIGGRPIEHTLDACVLVLEGALVEEGVRAAFAVDTVSSLSSVAPRQMTPTPRVGTLIDAAPVTALACLDERLVPILDLQHILSSGEVGAAITASTPAPVASGAAR